VLAGAGVDEPQRPVGVVTVWSRMSKGTHAPLRT